MVEEGVAILGVVDLVKNEALGRLKVPDPKNESN